VVIFDNRGMGKSTSTSGIYRMKDLADDAAAVLEEAGVRCAGVFGISMGGMIALELALRHPERVGALVLGATFAGYLRSKKPRLRATGALARANFNTRRGTLDVESFAYALVSDAHFAENPKGFAEWLASRPMASERGRPPRRGHLAPRHRAPPRAAPRADADPLGLRSIATFHSGGPAHQSSGTHGHASGRSVPKTRTTRNQALARASDA
jgi:pimeloyl-ACP methyl ester carboxylesterase